MSRLFPFCAALLALWLAGCGSNLSTAAMAPAPAEARFAMKPHGIHVTPYLWTNRSYVEGVEPFFPNSNDPFSETGCILDPVLTVKCSLTDITTRAAAISDRDVFLAMTDAVVAFKMKLGRPTPINFIFRSNISQPNALAFDRAGNLYVANVGVNNVDIFLRSNFSLDTPLSHYIHHGINHPTAMVFDHHENLFVANFGSNSVTAYSAANRFEYYEIITTGIHVPVALATDSRGYIYVANSESSTVTVYAPGSTSPAYTIVTGIARPSALAVNGSNDLYVANHGGNTVTVYAQDATTPKITLSENLYKPQGLALDDWGNLYVSDGSAVSVFTYAHNGYTYAKDAPIHCCGRFQGVLLGPAP
jgi:sugar lactone lactonase YvrE